MKYGFEISSKYLKKINNKSIGLIENSEYFLLLKNNTSGNVIVSIYINDKHIDTVEISQHSTYKLINKYNPNQFFIFKPIFSNKNSNFSNLRLEWRSIIKEYNYINNEKLPYITNDFPTKYYGETMLQYDKRINYDCSNKKFPDNTFSDELNLGISSDKYKLFSKYILDNPNIQEINMIQIIPEYNRINIKDYFVYNELNSDIPNIQFLNKYI